MVHLLEMYEKASRQLLNKEKPSIFFSTITPSDVNTIITSTADVRAIGTFKKYLGLLAMLGKNKSKSFHSLLDIIWNWILNWKKKFLLLAGKEILIKAVLQASPPTKYNFSCFQKPS